MWAKVKGIKQKDGRKARFEVMQRRSRNPEINKAHLLKGAYKLCILDPSGSKKSVAMVQHLSNMFHKESTSMARC